MTTTIICIAGIDSLPIRERTLLSRSERRQSSKFDGIEFTLEREVQENMLRTTGAQTTSLLTSAHPTTYLIVREPPNPQSTAKGQHFVDVSGLGTGAKATVLSGEIKVPENDLVHYAGHAYFDDKNRSQSGVLGAGNQVLSGRELATLDSLPALVVFNACESARVRSATLPTRMAQPRSNAKKMAPIDELVDRNVSMAEAFLRGGIASFVGTYWPVSDSAADLFARDFYAAILSGQSISESLLTARSTLFNAKEADWVNYIH